MPDFPDAGIWDVPCTGTDCKRFDQVSVLEAGYAVDTGEGANKTNTILGKQTVRGNVSNQTLIVESVPNSGQGVDVIYAGSTWYSKTANNAATGNDNTLFINLNNKDGTALKLNGATGSSNVTVSASAHQGGEASANTLLIKDSFLAHGTDASKRNLITSAYVYSQMDVDRNDGETVANFNQNRIIIENSDIKSGDTHNIAIMGVYLGGSLGTNHSDLSPFEAIQNAVFVKSSDLDINSLYVTYNAGTNPMDSSASGNVLWVEDTNLNVNFVKSRDASGKSAIGSVSIVGTQAFNEQNDNVLHLKNTKIELDQTSLPAQAVIDGNANLTIAATSGGDNAENNLTELIDVSFELIPSVADLSNSGGLIRIATSSSTYNSYAPTRRNANNTTRIVGTTDTLDWTLDGSRNFEVTGGWTLLTPDAFDSSTAAQVSAINNLASVQNVKFRTASIYGGYVQSAHDFSAAYPDNLTGTPEVRSNQVQLIDVQVTDNVDVAGGRTHQGNASENTVLIQGGSYARAELNGGLVDNAGSADGNTITVTNTKLGVGSVIYGGRVQAADANGSAINNSVIIGTNVTGTDGGVLQLDALYGGSAQPASGDPSNDYTGNTLYAASRLVTQELGGFQHYQFVTTQEQLEAGALIEVAGSKAVVLQADGDQHSTVAIGGTDITFEVGSAYTLIDSAAGFEDLTGQKLTAGTDLSGIKTDMVVESQPSVIRIDKTTFTKDDYDLSIVDGANGDQSLVIDIAGGGSTSSEINSETDALMESSLSTLTTHFAADDLFVDAVLRSRDGKHDGLFTAARGGKWSYDTRTRIENNIVSGLLGYGAKLSNDLTMGAFIEMGHGSYDTRTHISGSTKAGGGSHNYGGLGVFGDYAIPSIEGLHFTGYVKVGLLRNEFNSNIAGANVDYDRTGVYWGAHLGTHYDWDLTQSIRSRVFLSYFYDGQGDESFDIAGEGDVGGAHVSYDAIHAHRVQLGSMFEFAVSDTWRPYFGLTFEQILAAEAKGTATDAQGSFDLNSSDLEGSTGILSAGWTYQDGNFSTELGLNGYAGTRNGVSGQIQANWKF